MGQIETVGVPARIHGGFVGGLAAGVVFARPLPQPKLGAGEAQPGRVLVAQPDRPVAVEGICALAVPGRVMEGAEPTRCQCCRAALWADMTKGPELISPS